MVKNNGVDLKKRYEIPLSANSNRVGSKPFLKWVGGKTQLIDRIKENLPKNYRRYFEPFLGGGAVFFRLIPKDIPSQLSDINKNLISAYLDIRDRIYEVMDHLDSITGPFVNLVSKDERESYFYEIRENYNSLIDSESKSPLRTAMLIFLNKSCFNGVYRENSKGHFNVPFGHPKNSNVVNRSNILMVARDLKNKKIINKGFENLLNYAQEGDLIYFDPPYVPMKEGLNAFTKYHSTDFHRQDHEKLAHVFSELDKRGCFLMLSNSDSDLTRELYRKFNKFLVELDANRNINCKGELRKPVKELLIKNYL